MSQENELQPDMHANPHAVTGHHSHSDTVVLPYIGTLTAPGGIYTIVFGGLGILTLIEVVLSSLLGDALPIIKVVVLLGFAVAKALLVVMFYMHLRQDNRIFRVILGLPLLIVILAVLYLLGVPQAGGLGYPDATATPTITNTPLYTNTPTSTATPRVTATSAAEATSETEATSEALATSEAETVATSEPETVATSEAVATSETEATSEPAGS